MTGRFLKKLVGLGLGLGLALGATQAGAVTYNVTTAGIDSTAGSLNGTVYNNSPLVDEGAAIGRILLTGTDSNGNAFSFDSFCIDIFDNLHAQSGWSGGTLASLGLTTTQNSELTKLLANVDAFIGAGTNSTDKAERSAAAQMAIWEIVNEKTATMDVDGGTANKGTFYVTGLNDPNSGTALSEAATLISNVQSGGLWYNSTGTQVAIVSATGNQTQIIYGASAFSVLSAIPEPATWGMMVLGFGVVGGALRRKRDGAVHAIA